MSGSRATRSDSEDSRLQAAELIISLGSSVPVVVSEQTNSPYNNSCAVVDQNYSLKENSLDNVGSGDSGAVDQNCSLKNNSCDNKRNGDSSDLETSECPITDEDQSVIESAADLILSVVEEQNKANDTSTPADLIDQVIIASNSVPPDSKLRPQTKAEYHTVTLDKDASKVPEAVESYIVIDTTEQDNLEDIVLDYSAEDMVTEEILTENTGQEQTKVPVADNYISEYSIMMINKMKLEEIYAANGKVLVVEPKKGPRECNVCKQQFDKISELIKHKIGHEHDGGGQSDVAGVLRCGPCNIEFTDPAEHEKHKLQHLDVQLFKCCVCEDKFTDFYNYKVHLRIHERFGQYMCDKCPCTVFNERKKFIAHMEDHMSLKGEFIPGQPLQLRCNICGKLFPERYLLKRHQNYYHSNRKFRCSLCERTFVERNKLKRHMLSHNGQREHGCPYCDKTFSIKYNRDMHMNTHLTDKPYHCNICRLEFTRKYCLNRHMRIHRGYRIEYEGGHDLQMPAEVQD